SMDYEVFILTRMREEYDRSGSTQAAVVRGIGRTGRLVTSAALILFFAFAALASAPGTDIKVFATCLGVGILIDATIVRAVLVPPLVVLFGRWTGGSLSGWPGSCESTPRRCTSTASPDSSTSTSPSHRSRPRRLTSCCLTLRWSLSAARCRSGAR